MIKKNPKKNQKIIKKIRKKSDVIIFFTVSRTIYSDCGILITDCYNFVISVPTE